MHGNTGLALHLLLDDPFRGAINLCRERFDAAEQLQLLVLHLEERGPIAAGVAGGPRAARPLLPPTRGDVRSLVRDWAKECYAERGRPSIDPVVFFKLQLVMFFEVIRSERKLIETASLHLAHRWYLGYALDEEYLTTPA